MLRHRLHFGPYRTPKVRIGQRVEDEWRGTVKVVAISDGKIQWPIGYGPGGNSLVIYRGLARAIRKESSAAVQHWFGVTAQTLAKWRKAMGVTRTEGDKRLRSALSKRNKVAIAAMHATLQNPERCEKIAAAKLGKPRPAAIQAQLRTMNIGRKASAKTRAKMRSAAKARGAWPPSAGRPFSAEESIR